VDEARKRAEDAVRADAQAIDAKMLLGWCSLAQKRWGDAAQQLEEAAKVRTQDAALQSAIGYAYEKLGRRADAVAAFDRAIALEPAHPTAKAARGAALEAMGEVERARQAYESAVATSSPAAACVAKTRLAVAAYREKRFADARALAEAAVAADPSSAPARHVLGLACFALDDRACAGEQEYRLTTMDAERAADLRKLLSKE
jgi:tetratricopeptide (TPR) repeat protein